MQLNKAGWLGVVRLTALSLEPPARAEPGNHGHRRLKPLGAALSAQTPTGAIQSEVSQSRPSTGGVDHQIGVDRKNLSVGAGENRDPLARRLDALDRGIQAHIHAQSIETAHQPANRHLKGTPLAG